MRLLLSLLALCAYSTEAARSNLSNGTTLPQLNATAPVTISGLSGGAFFAVQFHVTYSALVSGAGILAGGPFYCAEDDLFLAEGRCMRFPEDIDVPALVEITKLTYETTSTIDNPKNLANSRVWLYSSTGDSVVESGVVKKLEKYYDAFLSDSASQMATVYNHSGEHAFPTMDQGSECDYLGKPFISDCDYDAAGTLLQHLFDGQLNDAFGEYDDEGLDYGQVVSFSQRSYLDELYTLEEAALNDVGYLYVPDQCTDSSAGCSVHVAFHGCEQTVWDIGESFVLLTGYNRWAAANNMIVLFPQALRTDLNPKGCFDWWGYTGEDYASKLGVQMNTVYRMIEDLL